MAKVQQRLLIAAALLGLLLPSADARRFYDDDPLAVLPPPVPVGKLKRRKVSEIYDFFYNAIGKPGEKSSPRHPIPSQAVNTLGEVPDNAWYTNRHGKRRMSIEELVRGPGNTMPPSPDGQWDVTAAKTEGVTPGFTIKDSKGRRYQLKFDAPGTYELSTGADVMGSKFFWAFGYFTPQNYIVYFHPEQLRVPPGTKWVDKRGTTRDMDLDDVRDITAPIERDPQGRLRAIASLYLEGEPIGPFKWDGVRSDDPNDFVPHENRRDLRGAKVFYAWVAHTDAKALNGLDTIVETKGVRTVRHNLIDFSAAFGAEAFEPKSPRSGYVYLLDWKDSARSFFTFGLAVPAWARADYKYIHAVGRMESQVFDPEKWKPNYYVPPFVNSLPDDGFWAAKTIMRFTEPEIRALVNTSQYSSKEGVDYLVRILVERQQKIGRAYFDRVLPLDEFRIRNGALEFDDLAVKYGFVPARQYSIAWSVFDNDSERKTPISGAASARIPSSDARYLAADIRAGEDGRSVTVYLRRGSNGYQVVGIDRTWRGGPQVISSR